MVNRSIIDGTLWTEVGAYLWEAKPQAPVVTNPQVPVQQQNTPPIAQAKATSTIKKSNVQSNNTIGSVNNIPSITPQAPIVQQPLDTTDTSWKVNLKDNKWWLQQRAEKTGVVKDWQVLDQTGLSNQAIARAWVLMKSKADAWEKIDEAVLQDIFDRQLKNVGIKAGTPQFAEAQKQMMSQFASQQQKLGHATIQDAFNSINSKYNDLSKLKLQSTNDIMNQFSSLTAEQKNYLEQNNPNYALAKAKVDAKAKADQINNTINKTAVSTKEQIKEENAQFAKWDTLAELESQEMRDLFWEISQYDDEIVTIQDEIDPKKLEKRIASQFPTSLTSWALRALADNEFNVKSEKLDKLMKLRELAKDTYETRRAEIIQNDKLIKERDNTVMESLLDNGWMGLMATSQKDIDQMVESGQLSKAGATLIKKQQQGMTDKTIMSMWKLTPEVQKKVSSLMSQWVPVSSIMRNLIETGQYSPTTDSSYTIEKVGENSYAKFNKATGDYEIISWSDMYNSVNAGTNIQPNNPDSLSKAIAFASTCDLNTKKQCGKWVNDIYRAVWMPAPFGNTLQSKLDAINSQAPVAWWSIVMQSPTKPENWHVMFVESVNQDGSINALEWNYDWSERARRTVVKANNPAIKWYYVPWWVKQWWQQMSNIDDAYNILTTSWQWDKMAEKNAQILSQRYTTEQIKQMYPDSMTQKILIDKKDSIWNISEKYNTSKNRLKWVQSVLNNPNASGKDIEFALKSFVASIDNTAAMAWEVEQAKTAGISYYDSINNWAKKAATGWVSNKTKKDIINTVNNFYKWIERWYMDYVDGEVWAITNSYWAVQWDKFKVYQPRLKWRQMLEQWVDNMNQSTQSTTGTRRSRTTY